MEASLPHEYGGIVPVYLWKCLDELYHKLAFISILIFSFLALYKACKGTRKEFTRRETARTGLQILFTMSPKSLQLFSYLDTNFKSIKKPKVRVLGECLHSKFASDFAGALLNGFILQLNLALRSSVHTWTGG